VCHREADGSYHTICIDPSGVQAHLDQGCQLGSCPSASRFTGKTVKGVGHHTDAALVTLSPNPLTDKGTLTYMVNNDSDVRIEVYSMLGSRVKTIVNTRQQAGNYQTVVDMSDLSIEEGIYLLKFEIDGETFVKRVIKTGK
jgi:hypothetical protein